MRHLIERARFFRLLSALLIFALGLPTPSALALRPIQEGKGRSGLEEALRPTAPASGLEELADQIQNEIQEVITGRHVISASDYPELFFPDQREFDEFLLWGVRRMNPKELTEAIRDLLAWMEGPLGMEDPLDVWIQPENQERFLVAVIRLVSLRKLMPDLSTQVENRIFEGLLSKEFLQASFEIDPIVFSQVISHVGSASSDAELHTLRVFIDDAPANRRPVLQLAYQALQAGLLADVPSLKAVEQEATGDLPRTLPILAQRVLLALQKTPDAATRFWTERIDPQRWRNNPQVAEMVQWISAHSFPMRNKDLNELFLEFADRRLQASIIWAPYVSARSPEVVAALQELLKPETRQAVERALSVPDDEGQVQRNVVQADSMARFRIPGVQLPEWTAVPRNPYGDVLFYQSLPADYRQQFPSYQAYIEALHAARLKFYLEHRDEVAPPAVGLEEVLSGEEAQHRFVQIRRDFVQGASVREVSRRFSSTMMGLLRHVEKEAVGNLQTKIPVRIVFADGTSRVTAYMPGDPKLQKYPQAEYTGQNYFIVATGSLGRQDDFSLGSDADFIVFPSNSESVAYAQALQAEMTEVLGNTLSQHAADFKADERMTAAYDFQVPPEQVPEKLLVPTLLSYDIREDITVLAPSITSYVFRDMAFLSGDRKGFDRLSEMAVPVLYPYDGDGKAVNPRGIELIELLIDQLRLGLPNRSSPPEKIDLKEGLLRPIQMFVWLMRARQEIISPSVFEALNELEDLGVSRSEELARAYEFMLLARNILYDLRGRTTFALPTQKPDYRIPERLQSTVAQRMGLSLPDFLQQFQTHADAIRSIVSQQTAGLEERWPSKEIKQFVTEFQPVSGHVFDPEHSATYLMLEAMQRIEPLFDHAKVLDTGTGSGVLGLWALARLNASRVVATDLRKTPLTVASKNAVRLNVTDRIEFRQGSLLSPVNGESFDITLFNPPGMQKARQYLHQLNDVLKPDGIALQMWFEDVLKGTDIDARLLLESEAHSAGFSVAKLLDVDIWTVYVLTKNPKRLQEVLQTFTSSYNLRVKLAERPPAAGLEEPVMVSPAQVPGFDVAGVDTPELQQGNVLALLEFLEVNTSGFVVNVGSGVRPLTFGDSPRRRPLNLDTQSFARPAADRIGAEYADADVIQIAGAVAPGRTETLPEILLFYRMVSFVDIYHGHNPQEFWQAAWKLVRPGGWILLVNPPFPEFPIRTLDHSYQQVLSSLAPGERPSEVRVVTPDGTLTNALAIAIRKPAVGLEEDWRPSFYTGTYERVLEAAGRVVVPPGLSLLHAAQTIVGQKAEEDGIHYIRFEPLLAVSSMLADDASGLFSIDGQGRIRLSDDWMNWIGTVPGSALTWLGVRDHAELWNAEGWSRFQQEKAGRFEEMESAGLEEQQAAWRVASELADGFRSRSVVDSRTVVVIGRDLAQRVPGLQVLSGLEERVVIDRGDLSDTLARVVQIGDTVYFYGDPQRGAGLEELAGRSGLSLSFVLRNPGEDPKVVLVLRQIFEDLEVPSADISTGLEEFTRRVETLGVAA